jgi:hypothetical protein
MCYMMSLSGKDNTLESGNHISILRCPVRLTFDLVIMNIYLLWVVHMYDIVTLGKKGNALEPINHIVTFMSSALDL